MKTRHRKNYYELLTDYLARRAKAEVRLDVLVRRVITLTLRMHKARQEVRSLRQRAQQASDAINRGELHPPKAEKKKKGGRRIELD